MILGVNAPPTGWHDPAACLVEGDGTLLAFCEEERLSRAKHAARSGPVLAVEHCLRTAGATPGDVELVAIGWDVPLSAPLFGVQWRLEDTPAWLERYLGLECTAQDMPEVRFVGHHLAHATIAFQASDFETAAVLVVDGNGDDESISMYRAQRDRPLVRTRVWPRSHSLGYLYDAACRFVGFGHLQAGKLMGLSAYVRTLPAARTVMSELQHPRREQKLVLSQFDLWIIRVLGTVAAGCFILLLFSILRVFFCPSAGVVRRDGELEAHRAAQTAPVSGRSLMPRDTSCTSCRCRRGRDRCAPASRRRRAAAAGRRSARAAC